MKIEPTGPTNGLAVGYDMESEGTGSQDLGLSHWKDELAIDLAEEDQRGAGWEEVEELREFRKKQPLSSFEQARKLFLPSVLIFLTLSTYSLKHSQVTG